MKILPYTDASAVVTGESPAPLSATGRRLVIASWRTAASANLSQHTSREFQFGCLTTRALLSATVSSSVRHTATESTWQDFDFVFVAWTREH